MQTNPYLARLGGTSRKKFNKVKEKVFIHATQSNASSFLFLQVNVYP
jgi:hypothetical protein